MSRRPLGDVVAELAAVVSDPSAQAGIRVTRLRVDVPIEIELRGAIEDPEMLGDLPRWRWRSAFDREPGRMSLVLREEAAS